MVEQRDFRHEPVTFQELLGDYVFPVVDDLIGGYSIATVDKPESEINPYEGEFTIGSFMTKDVATYFANLHNRRLQDAAYNTYYDNVEHAKYEDIARAIEAYYGGQKAPLPEGVAPLTEDEWFDYDDTYVEATQEPDQSSR